MKILALSILAVGVLYFCTVPQCIAQEQESGVEGISEEDENNFNNSELASLDEAKSEIVNNYPNASVIKARFNARPLNRNVKFPLVAEIIGSDSLKNLKLYEILLRAYPENGLCDCYDKTVQLLLIAQESREPICSRTRRYRNIDGTCNNFNKPLWGAQLIPFKRLLPAEYEDDFGVPRGGLSNGGRLPNVRLISSSLHPDLIHPDPNITHMVAQLGQFLDHDLSLTPEADKKCCTTDKDYVDCFPIKIANNDSFYSIQTPPQNCLDFTRSTVFCFPTKSGKREQFNILTAYIDLSSVYGSDSNRGIQVRSFSDGLLRINTTAAFTNFLPSVQQVETATRGKIKFLGKYLAGDDRVNETPGLAAMHTLWMREHNRVAVKLKEIRPNWNDEKLFQETRRIVIAEWQNVVYGGYLPVILGSNAMTRYGLTVNNTHSKYSASVDATIFHEFATAAYRFGHTLINGIVELFRGLNRVGFYTIRNNFFEADQLEQNQGEGIELIFGGLMIQSSQSFDRFVTEDLTQHLLKKRTEKFGSDLIARNIQRGRDHGIRSYNHYRVMCHLEPLTDWQSRPEEIPELSWTKLSQLYDSPRDIDLFSGGLVENPVTDGVTGPTFNCIKGLQFKNTKRGDRFFFTHKGQVSSFTLDQLESIRSRNLGNVICDNTNVQETPEDVFRPLSQQNVMVACNDSSRHDMDLDNLI